MAEERAAAPAIEVEAAADEDAVAVLAAAAVAAPEAVAVEPEAEAPQAEAEAPEAEAPDADTLGKRKSRDGGDEVTTSLKKHKLPVPDALVDDLGVAGVQQALGFRTLRPVEEKSGAKIVLRGQGAGHAAADDDAEASEPLHLSVEGSEEAIAIANMTLEKLLHDPAEIAKIKAGLTRKHKIYIPDKVKEEVNILAVLIGPKGVNLRAMQDRSGAKISVRGKGSSKEGVTEEEREDPLHVLVDGTEAAIAIASKEIEHILHTPGEAVRLKNQQLAELAHMKAIRQAPPQQQYGYGAPPPHYVQYGGYRPPMYGAPQQGYGYNGHPPQYGGVPPPHGYGGPQQPAYGMYPPAGGAPPQGGPSTANAAAFPEELTFTIPNGVVGIVVGKQGCNIQKVQADYNVNVQVTKLEGNGGPEDVARPIPVVLKGTRDGCEGAKAAIFALISERQAIQASLGQMGGPAMQGYSQQQQQQPPQHAQQQQQQSPAAPPITPAQVISLVPSTPQVAISVVVPNDKVGLIIGKGGCTIKAMQIKTGAKLQIPQGPDMDDPTKRTLTVLATTREIADACTREIAAVLEQGPGGGGAPPPGAIHLQVHLLVSLLLCILRGISYGLKNSCSYVVASSIMHGSTCCYSIYCSVVSVCSTVIDPYRGDVAHHAVLYKHGSNSCCVL
jgi:transcription antitermination factor NusA-like protein